MFNRKLKKQVAELQATVDKQQKMITYGACGMGVMGVFTIGSAVATYNVHKTMETDSQFIISEFNKMHKKLDEILDRDDGEYV